MRRAHPHQHQLTLRHPYAACARRRARQQSRAAHHDNNGETCAANEQHQTLIAASASTQSAISLGWRDHNKKCAGSISGRGHDGNPDTSRCAELVSALAVLASATPAPQHLHVVVHVAQSRICRSRKLIVIRVETNKHSDCSASLHMPYARLTRSRNSTVRSKSSAWAMLSVLTSFLSSSFGTVYSARAATRACPATWRACNKFLSISFVARRVRGARTFPDGVKGGNADFTE